MSTWQGTTVTQSFKDNSSAITSLSEDENNPFVISQKITASTQNNPRLIVNQLNYLIQAVTTIQEEVQTIKEELASLKGVDQVSGPLENIQKEIANLKLGASSSVGKGIVYPSAVQKYYVFKDPNKILEEELEKDKRR